MNSCDILFVIRSMGRGGAERQLSVLARRLHAMGFNVAVAMFYAEGALLDELVQAGIPIVDLKKRGRWTNLGVVMRLMRFIQTNRPQVVHAYLPVENIVTILLKPWIKAYGGAVVCGIRIAKFDARSYGVLMRMVYFVQRLLLRFADRVISNSTDALVELRKWIPSGRGFAVPNGIETQRFVHDQGKRVQQRAAWMLSDDAIAIGIVGRLDPQKNHCLAIGAMPAIIRRYPATKLVIVGGGATPAYLKSMTDQAESLGVVDHLIWAGASDDMASVYSAIDILCLPSLSEGFPNVVAEAMCAGLPCVATNVGDTAEVIGNEGWVIRSNDSDALVSALIDAIHRRPAWDADGPRRRIAENFSEESLVERTLAALGPLIHPVSGHLPGASRIGPAPPADA